MIDMALCALASFALLTGLPAASAHGWIKSYSINGGQQQVGQKVPLETSAFRSVSNNTGWIGSANLNSPGLVCGAYQTPFNANAPPSGPFFSDATQSAGQTANIPAGGTVTLLVAGNPGKGWWVLYSSLPCSLDDADALCRPHRLGHELAYLGYCGAATDACQNFDASTAKFFKILQRPDSAAALADAYDPLLDGNPVNVTIPSSLRAGSYLLRFELIDFDQANAAESYQDNYYPYCLQLFISSVGNDLPDGVSFPAAYANDPLILGGVRNYLPGPAVWPPAPASKSGNVGAIAGGAAGGAAAISALLLLAFCFIRRRRQNKRWQAGAMEGEIDEHNPDEYAQPKVDTYLASPPLAHDSLYKLPGDHASSAGTPSIYSDRPAMRESYVPPPVPNPATRPLSASTARPMSRDSSMTTPYSSQPAHSMYEAEHGHPPVSPSANSVGFVSAPSASGSELTYEGKRSAGPQDVERPLPVVHEDGGPVNSTDIPPIYRNAWAAHASTSQS